MRISSEFHDIPEMAGMSVGDAKTMWEQFVAKDRWFKSFRRLLIAPVALALLPPFQFLFSADSYLPNLAAFIVAMEMVLALDRPFQVFLFRRTLTKESAT
jgi:hypothetical protein